MLSFNLIVFFGGVALGMFAAVILMSWLSANRDHDLVTPEEFEQYRKEWDELADQYGVYEPLTADELFLDLEDEEE